MHASLSLAFDFFLFLIGFQLKNASGTKIKVPEALLNIKGCKQGDCFKIPIPFIEIKL